MITLNSTEGFQINSDETWIKKSNSISNFCNNIFSDRDLKHINEDSQRTGHSTHVDAKSHSFTSENSPKSTLAKKEVKKAEDEVHESDDKGNKSFRGNEASDTEQQFQSRAESSVSSLVYIPPH